MLKMPKNEKNIYINKSWNANSYRKSSGKNRKMSLVEHAIQSEVKYAECVTRRDMENTGIARCTATGDYCTT